jgi:hypothetical protein
MTEDLAKFISRLKIDELVKSQFPLPWWEGIKGRGKIIVGKC